MDRESSVPNAQRSAHALKGEFYIYEEEKVTIVPFNFFNQWAVKCTHVNIYLKELSNGGSRQ